MKYRHDETPGSSSPGEITTGLYERYEIDDDGVFEIPDDDLDAAMRRRLEEAGHEPVDAEPVVQGTEDDEADSDGAAASDEEGDDTDETELEGDDPDDEYSDMDRSELYEVYKDRGGPKSWNDTDVDGLRHDLRVHDEVNSFPTAEPDDDETETEDDD